MTRSASVPHAASRLEFLVQRLEAFERFHSGDARLRIQELVDLIERDDVLGCLRRAVEEAQRGSAQEWFEVGFRIGSLPPLPEEPAAALGLRWSILRRVRQDKVDLRQFVATTCPGAHLNEKLMHWKRLVVHPLAHDLRALCDLVREELQGEWADIEAVTGAVLRGSFAARAFGSRPWNDEDDARATAAEQAARPRREPPASPAAPAPPPPGSAPSPALPASEAWSLALARLEAAIATVPAPLGDDLQRDAQALRLEGWRPTRQPARIEARLRSLARHPELAVACAELLRAL